VRRRRREPIRQPEQSLDQRAPLVPLVSQLGDDRLGPLAPFLGAADVLLTHVLPPGLKLAQVRSGSLLTSDRFSLHRRGALGARCAFGNHFRQFLPSHERDCARPKRKYGSQIGEILQRVSVNSVTFSLDPIGRDDPEVRRLYADFVREADGPLVYDREGAGVDLDEEIAKGPPEDLVPPNGVLLLARADGEAAGLGGVRYLDTEIAEVKSMYVAPPFRGSGLGRQILARLDEIALEHGCRAVRLDTSDYLTPAVGLYRAAGYREVPAYNKNPKADLWFERPLRQDD
jgi:GNAT superfamily N-acetyltransferase